MGPDPLDVYFDLPGVASVRWDDGQLVFVEWQGWANAAEFAALLATWDAIGYWVLIPLIILVVTAAFYIWMMQRMLFGPPKGVPETAHDIPWYEASGMAVLFALIVIYGILPYLLVNVIVASPIKAWP